MKWEVGKEIFLDSCHDTMRDTHSLSYSQSVQSSCHRHHHVHLLVLTGNAVSADSDPAAEGGESVRLGAGTVDNVVHLQSGGLAEVGKLVDEGDVDGAVGVLEEFGCFRVVRVACRDDVGEDGGVELDSLESGGLVDSANHLGDVTESRELACRVDALRAVGDVVAAFHHVGKGAAGVAHSDGGLEDDQGSWSGDLEEGLLDFLDDGEIREFLVGDGGGDADDVDIAVANVGSVAGELETLEHVVLDVIDGGDALVVRLDALLVDVEAGDLMALIFHEDCEW